MLISPFDQRVREAAQTLSDALRSHHPAAESIDKLVRQREAKLATQ